MELKVYHRHMPLFLFLNRMFKIIVFNRHEWQHSGQKLIIDPHRHEFTRMNLSTSPLPDVPLLTSRRQIFGVESEGTQVNEINLR
jgi:hypothetical protein